MNNEFGELYVLWAVLLDCISLDSARPSNARNYRRRLASLYHSTKSATALPAGISGAHDRPLPRLRSALVDTASKAGRFSVVTRNGNLSASAIIPAKSPMSVPTPVPMSATFRSALCIGAPASMNALTVSLTSTISLTEPWRKVTASPFCI